MAVAAPAAGSGSGSGGSRPQYSLRRGARLRRNRVRRDNGTMGGRIGPAGLLVVALTACGGDPVEPPDAPCATAEEIDGLRMNQLQVVGSHNSYRRRTYAPLLTFVQSLSASLPDDADPSTWDY